VPVIPSETNGEYITLYVISFVYATNSVCIWKFKLNLKR